MCSFRDRIAILTSLADQLRELEQLREQVRKAELSKRPAGTSRRIDHDKAAREPSKHTPGSAVAGLFGRPAQPREPSGANLCRGVVSAVKD
jgi:hypothetical protein